ncbi:MAG TPA: rhodanese-like domain-containing protein [Rhodoferax sp.]
MKSITLLFFGLTLPVFSYAQVVEVGLADALPYVDQNAKQQWQKYVDAKPNKAYAIAETGAWSWVQSKASEAEASAAAIAKCETFAFPCFLFAVNGTAVWEKEHTAEAVGKRVKEKLKTAVLEGEFGKERETSFFVGPTESIGRNYHSMTPPTIPGGKTYSTKELRDLMVGDAEPVLIDVLQGGERVSIPGALLIPGAGVQESALLEERFAEVLAASVPDKSTPVVFFCLSYECWLSYNAALRAIRLGYKNVIWYRGGIEAWKAAKLPVLRAKPVATL